MKYNLNEIYNIGRKVLKNSTLGFDDFLENSIFSYITQNHYLMRRPKEELSAWILLDFEEFRNGAYTLLNSFLQDLDVDSKDYDEIIDVLRESYVSLFEVEKNDEGYIFHDKLLEKDYNVKYSKSLINLYHEKGLFRIFGSGDEKIVLQTIRLMDDVEFYTLHTNLLKLFEELGKKIPDFKIDKFTLKQNLLNILSVCEVTSESIYGEEEENFLFEFSDSELDEAFYDEDLYVLSNTKDFQKVLHNKDESYILSFFDYTFTKIYRKVLEDNDNSFKNYDLDYKAIFNTLCKGGDFSESNQLIESVDMVTLFYKKLARLGREVDKPIKTLEYVKKNIFDYIKLLDESIAGFYYGDNLPQLIAVNNLNIYSNKFIENYDNFLTFLDINYVRLLKSGDLSPAMLKGFIEDAEIEPIRYVKTYKNKHFPLIQLYLSFTIIKGLTYLYDPGEVQDIYLTDEADKYMQFDDLEKLSIWIDVLSKEEFLKSAFGENYDSYRKLVLNLFENLIGDKNIFYEDFNKEDKVIVNILLDLDLIKNNHTLEFTQFGEAVYNYFRVDETKDNIIEIDFS